MKRRLFSLGFASMVMIAMVGWCTALGWLAISVVEWMVSYQSKY
jgi:hypothetical protein